jgi:hypothetical protein
VRSRVPCPSSARSPLEECPYVSELDDKIGELLEAAGISQEYCDRISALVQEAEAARSAADTDLLRRAQQ